MNNYAFDVTFEAHEDHIKAFVNKQPCGRVKFKKGVLSYRHSENPFTNTIPRQKSLDANTPMVQILEDMTAIKCIIPVVIRNYLRNSAYIYNLIRKA